MSASKGRLAVHVYARNAEDQVVWFGPDDDVPAWAAEQITNPDAWETAPKGAKLDEGSVAAGDGSGEPPLAGAGSSKAAWKEYAEAQGIDVPEDATRDDIVALVHGE